MLLVSLYAMFYKTAPKIIQNEMSIFALDNSSRNNLNKKEMFIYNVTLNIANEIELKWLDWMRKKHIPAMLATGKFSKAKLVQVLVNEEMGGITYSVQYTTDSKATLEAYYKEDAASLREEALQLFPKKFVAFRTELQVIEEFTK